MVVRNRRWEILLSGKKVNKRKYNVGWTFLNICDAQKNQDHDMFTVRTKKLLLI